jgi:hypothetical protein
MDGEDLSLSGSEVMMTEGEKEMSKEERKWKYEGRYGYHEQTKGLEIKRKQKAKRWYMQQKDTLEMCSRIHGSSLTILASKR